DTDVAEVFGGTTSGDLAISDHGGEIEPSGLAVERSGSVLLTASGAVQLGEPGAPSVKAGDESGSVLINASDTVRGTGRGRAAEAPAGAVRLVSGADISLAFGDADVLAGGDVLLSAGRDVRLTGDADVVSGGFGKSTPSALTVIAGQDVDIETGQ